jgi:glycosyltransferase involved in cell wall biosynthesis
LRLERRVAELGLGDRVVFAGRLPFDELVRYLGAVDVCLSTQSDDLLGRARTTAKLPLYMAAGRYVLASRVGEAERVLPESMLVSYRGEYDPSYPRRLAERVEWLLQDPERLAAADGLVAEARVRYDYAGLAERLARAIEAETCPR